MKTLVTCMVILGVVSSASADTVIFSNDFNAELPPTISPGSALLTGIQGFSGLGPTGNQFDGSFLRSATGNMVTVTLTGLPAHSTISLDFLFAAIDSLDGTGSFPSGDFFKVTLDGNQIFRESFANAVESQVQSYVPPPAVELARWNDLGFSVGGFYRDSAYHLGADPTFQNIAHIGSSATFTFQIEGSGIQDLSDESWAMDNLRIGVMSVPAGPEPSTNCQLDPRSTFLKPTTGSDLANLEEVQDAKKIGLTSGLPFAVSAGDWLRLSAVGDFKFAYQDDPPPVPGPYGDGTLRDAIGIFSSSGTLVPITEPISAVPAARVPGAVSVVEGSFSDVVSDPANDIVGDFGIPTESVVPRGVLVRVPLGATHLFLGAADEQWWDNNPIPPEGDYGVNITRIYAGRFLGDWDFDGFVDGSDFLLWQQNLGSTGVDLPGDGNLDGRVDAADLQIWKDHFGQSVPASTSVVASNAAVPEPSSAALGAATLALVLVASGVSGRRRDN